MGLPPGGFRPLQIPTCRKRCLGAYWAVEVGPAVEPLLSPHQTAKHGGGLRLRHHPGARPSGP
eukprot:9757075-Lingulodinium_polyedra.AAC.1